MAAEIPSVNCHQQSHLTQALCSLAQAFALSKTFPLQAREFALVFQQLAVGIQVVFPEAWTSKAAHITKLPLERKATQSETKTEDPPNALLVQWARIRKGDRSAPAVMDDSVLPMIGLDSIKRKFITMYHRVKLAQEQGDTTGSDYNVRFEGNPGTGKCDLCTRTI